MPAVVLSAGCDFFVTEGPLSIDKPVRIEAGAHLYPLQTLTVEAGGSLRVEGSLAMDIGIVRVCAGGEISVGEGGILAGDTAGVLEGTEGFTVEPGGTAVMGGVLYGAEGSGARFFEVGLDFAQAERVTSYAEPVSYTHLPSSAAISTARISSSPSSAGSSASRAPCAAWITASTRCV